MSPAQGNLSGAGGASATAAAPQSPPYPVSEKEGDPAGFLSAAYSRLRAAVSARDDSTLPSQEALSWSSSASPLPDPTCPSYLRGIGPAATLQHIHDGILPALNGQNLSSRYYGFVTGATLPIAEAADNVVSAMDQNVQVHLPAQSAATAVEHAALGMAASLLRLDPAAWTGRTFTTGATASNVLGLALGREAVVAGRLAGRTGSSTAGEGEGEGAAGGVAELGVLEACLRAGLHELQVVTSMGHSSLYKAAAVVGLGRASVRELPLSADEPWRLDLRAVERELAREGVASIVVVSAGEVNTGRFATLNGGEMQELRRVADRYGAWIHVDGAFGIFARALPETPEFALLHERAGGLELADSITADGHKLLNVPYDTGIFFTRSPAVQMEVFKNANAVYLAAPTADGIPSPLHLGLENSRRFRSLPVYAVLLSEGRDGLAEMFARMVRMARRVAAFVRASAEYELLPEGGEEETHIIVMFRARDDAVNETLVQRVNETRRMYVSGTMWKGRKAVRLAVSNWRVDIDQDAAVVEEVLRSIAVASS